MKKLVLLCIVLATTISTPGCKPPPVYYLKREATIEQLSICITYQSDVSVPYKIQTNFDAELSKFIQQYNAEKHSFKITTCQNPEQTSLRLTVYETRMVSPEKQAAGVFVSLLGFATPFILIGAGSPIIFSFWYFPKDLSAVEHSLSSDLRANVMPKSLTYVSNPGFLRSPEKQLIKHTEAFGQFLRYHVTEVEKAYVKSQNTPAGVPIR